MRVSIDQGVVNERLFNYFIYPNIEKKIGEFKLVQYIEVLRLLAELGYQDDLVFWSEHVLPAMFNHEFSYGEAKELWEVFLKVKVNCPSVDLAKYAVMIENIIKQFENLKEEGKDVEELYLSIDKDSMAFIPKKKVGITSQKLREAERRLSYQPSLQKLFEGEQVVKEKSSMEEELNKLLEIKDWKKAKYEMQLAEAMKAKEEADKKELEMGMKISEPETSEAVGDDENIPTVEAEKVELNEEGEEEPTGEAVKKDAADNDLGTKYLNKRLNKIKKAEKEMSKKGQLNNKK